jgi:hypothetical protein
MNLRFTLARQPIALVSSILILAALTAFGCGGDSTPSGPSSTAPIVRSLTPTTGTSFGGTEITITGERFVAGAAVTFGGVPGLNIAVENGTTIRATTPPHASGAVDVQVSASTGNGVLAQAFTFLAPGVTNTAPVIRSVTAKGRKSKEPIGFADLGETIDVTAIVEDAETAIDKLTFQWSASVGTVTGTGPVATWSAPASATTPGDVTLTLTVVETYKAPDTAGLPVDKENRATSNAVVSLHNSVKEFGDMAYDFLVNFSHSDIGVDQVLRNFSTSCTGYGAERKDVVDNRANFLITAYTVATPVVTINFGGTCNLFPDRFRPGDACANVAVQWTSTTKSTGISGATKGTDQVTGIYDGKRWWLCDSDYLGVANSTALGHFKK